MTLATTANLNATTPAPASGKQNIVFADDAGTPTVNISATDPAMVGDTGSGGTAGKCPGTGVGRCCSRKVPQGRWHLGCSSRQRQRDLYSGGGHLFRDRRNAGSQSHLWRVVRALPQWHPDDSDWQRRAVVQHHWRINYTGGNRWRR